ncbi:MAG: HAD family hydrolase [Pedobacter sp.]|nr:MAG: HAD family hydrolase [Pedobacter sp.]
MQMKKAYFIDLDNTIYFTRPHVDILLGPLYNLLEKEDLGISKADFEKAKEDMLSTPFQKVAQKYNFNAEAVVKAIAYLSEKVVTAPLAVHNQYRYVKALSGLKIIVTAGFEKSQRSKIEMLGIADDFDEVYVVDVDKENKKDAFAKLLKKHNLKLEDVLVIGDDAKSEIKYGLELGLDTFLFDPDGRFAEPETTYHKKTFEDLASIK